MASERPYSERPAARPSNVSETSSGQLNASSTPLDPKAVTQPQEDSQIPKVGAPQGISSRSKLTLVFWLLAAGSWIIFLNYLTQTLTQGFSSTATAIFLALSIGLTSAGIIVARGRRPSNGTVIIGLFLLISIVAAPAIIESTSLKANTQTQAESIEPSEMLALCKEKVAIWANVSVFRVTGVDLNDQNPSGAAWDFEGDYPSGSWRCGGPSGHVQPTQILVYPRAGATQDIIADPTNPSLVTNTDSPTNADPAVIVGQLAEETHAASASCLSAMQELANTSYSDTDENTNSAAKKTAQDCTTVGEYTIAMRAYPGAYGMTSSSYVDGQSALFAIRSVCTLDRAAPTCADAAKHGLL